MEKKIVALAETTTRQTVIHADYNNSLECSKLCIGCNKRFQHNLIDPEATDDAPPIVTNKCLSYSDPAAKWPAEGQQFAMHTVMVRDPGNKTGKGMSEKEVPILEKYCPLASHYTPVEVIKQGRKILAGQQKQGRG